MPASVIKLNEKVFKERRDSLLQRASLISSGLGSMGLQTALLDTQGLIELYYSVYNPDVADTERMADVNKLRVETKF